MPRLLILRMLLPFVSAAALCLVGMTAAAISEEEAARAQALGLIVYHEGFPPEYADQITAAGATRLAELLADPAHTRYHATLIEALGLSGQPGAFEALADYAAAETGDAVGPGIFRAHKALPVAMGQLARDDDRALAWLLESVTKPGPAEFRAGPQDRGRVGERLRQQALYGLGLSGRAEALPALRSAAAGDARAARAARDALDLHQAAREPLP